ncbi:hypothetical protein DTO166G4_7286 [Paecilomyces variotii]|nr:hypothetical protein DTO032I3_8436 [Paecilomyces variotii]KAJ9202189.1 hypothetical protein DTO164E3_3118 [Paecilomyces variotii]KAJ9211149.1 hypothetical protein DTO166G4_7286 [Paecilomyces variotii]KAJ9223446.1 hypothetical protein DTO169C6_4253 [Paecilomyces variotii]KAJ9228688.1 hypothetical protein DTO166G5_8381 [Paecilomyces variotii]
MMNNTALLQTRMEARNLKQMRSIPVWRWRDTPIRAVYRIYEIMAARHHIAMWQEVEYFFKQAGKSWALGQIPDPHDDDPVRYAIIACIIEELVEAVNWRLSIGMRRNGKGIYRESIDDPLPPFVPEKGPFWTEHVPAIDLMSIADLPAEMLDSSGRLVLEPDGESSIFAKRNIVTNTGYFYTV